MKVQISAVESIGSDVKVLVLEGVGSQCLPAWTPGAHIDVELGNGMTRSYSLFTDPTDPGRWRVAVRLDANTRGGSAWIHSSTRPGTVLECSAPRNNFELVDAPAYLFLAGGIGVTPFVSQCLAASERGSKARLAFGGPRDLLAGFLCRFAHVPRLKVDLFDASAGTIPLADLIADADPGTAVYCCGPSGMIDATRELVSKRSDLTLNVEAFTANEATFGADEPVTVELARSGMTINVPADQSVLDAIVANGVFLPSSCGEGTCGTCEVAVLAGKPDHRDVLIDPDDPERDQTIMVCVSRALTGRLVLDL